jgi:hypothetical protein
MLEPARLELALGHELAPAAPGKPRTYRHPSGHALNSTQHEFLEFSQLAWPRRQNLPVARYCDIARVRMDSLAVLRGGLLGNHYGNPVCAALSESVEVLGAEAHTRCPRYSDDHPADGDSAVNADRRAVAAGRVQRVREAPVGRAECRPVLSAGV